MKKTLFLLFLALLLVWSNFSLDTGTEAIALARLPRDFDGFRLLHLSDLHGRSFGEGNARLLAAAQAAAPDLICLTGDIIDENTDFTALLPFLQKLAGLAPTYFVTGNHEWQVPHLSEHFAALEAAGITVLRNEFHILWRGGARLVIAGVDDPCGPAEHLTPEALVDEIHAAAGRDVPIIMLDHRNDHLSLWEGLGVELVLSGHCHGGLVRLPILGGLFGPGRRLLPDWDAGLYRRGGTALYVSRGLASFRLGNRPHLPLLILHHS